jgi:hypothetical protein
MNLLSVIEEQVLVKFTGKVNVLSKINKQYFGHLILKDGDLIDVVFKRIFGLKAFYQIAIEEHMLEHFAYVVEPEIVDDAKQSIHYPFLVLKNKLHEVIQKHLESVKFKPPQHLKVTVEVGFLNSRPNLNQNEFEVLDTLTEWNLMEDIYLKCKLLDHEITMALVSLRQKGALKIIAPMSKEI